METNAQTLGMFLICAMLVVRWIWEYKRDQRAERAEVEPRHNPPIAAQIESRVATAEGRIAKEIEVVRKETKEEVNHLHGRVSGLRDEVKTALAQMDSRQEERLRSVTQGIQETRETVAGLAAKVETAQQAQFVQSQQIVRMLERGNHE